MSPWLPWRRPPAPAIGGWEPPQSQLGLAALAIAEAELMRGGGESLGDNLGPDLDRYRRGGPGGAWCAAFVSYCLEEGAASALMTCPVKRTHGAKKLFARCLKVGMRINTPMPGDVACWHRGAAGARTGHVGIVRTGLLNGVWTAIEGNKGRFPSRVRAWPHELDEPLFLGWVRLP